MTNTKPKPIKSRERYGIPPGWVRNSKPGVKRKQTCEEDVAAQGAELSIYATTGRTAFSMTKYYSPSPPVDPKFEPWDSALHNDLHGYADREVELFQVNTLREGVFDRQNALNAFWASYYAALIVDNNAYLDFKRWSDRKNPSPTLAFVSLYAVLGWLLGCHPQAQDLARLQLHMIRTRGYGRRYSDRPVSSFCLRLMADYLGESDIEPAGRVLAYPTYLELFAKWRHPDPLALHELCLRACDVHTRQANKAPDDWDAEFWSVGPWDHFPLEILLLFKFRHALGLENPVLDHPLMNSPLASVPEAENKSPEAHLQAVFDRMHSQGFDDQKIIRRIFDDEFGVDGPNSLASPKPSTIKE